MAEFKLNVKENLVDSFESKPVYLARRDYQIYFILSLVLILGGGFFVYSYLNLDEAMYLVLAFIFFLAAVGTLSYYVFNVVNARKKTGDKKYYLTNIRLVITNNDNQVIRELLLNKVKRVDVEKYGFNKGTIILNKKIDQRRKGQLKQRKTLKPVYSSETFLIESVGNLKRLTTFFDISK